MGKKKVILILFFAVLLCAGGLIVFILHRPKWKPSNFQPEPELLELPGKESLKLSERFSIEDIHYADGIVKVKFSNASEDRAYLYIEAKGLEVWQEGGWKELYYVRWSEDIYREDNHPVYTEGLKYYQYGVEPDWLWIEYGRDDDSISDLISRNEAITFIIKTAKERYGILEKGEYRVFYIVSDKEKAVEIAYQTFSVE